MEDNSTSYFVKASERAEKVMTWIKSLPVVGIDGKHMGDVSFFSTLSIKFQFDIAKKDWEKFWLPLQIERFDRIMESYHGDVVLGAELNHTITPSLIIYELLPGVPVDVIHLLMSCWICPTPEYMQRHDTHVTDVSVPDDEELIKEFRTLSFSEASDSSERMRRKTLTNKNIECIWNTSSFRFANFYGIKEKVSRPNLETFLYLNRMTSKILFYCLKRYFNITHAPKTSDYVNKVFCFFRCLIKMTLKFNLPLGDNDAFEKCKRERNDPYKEFETAVRDLNQIGMVWENFGYTITANSDYDYYHPTMLTFLIDNFEFFSFHLVENVTPNMQFIDIELCFKPFVLGKPYKGQNTYLPFLYDSKGTIGLLFCATNTPTLNQTNVFDSLKFKNTYEGSSVTTTVLDRLDSNVVQVFPLAMRFSEGISYWLHTYLMLMNKWLNLRSYKISKEILNSNIGDIMSIRSVIWEYLYVQTSLCRGIINHSQDKAAISKWDDDLSGVWDPTQLATEYPTMFVTDFAARITYLMKTSKLTHFKDSFQIDFTLLFFTTYKLNAPTRNLDDESGDT